jgi:hypothetical protein
LLIAGNDRFPTAGKERRVSEAINIKVSNKRVFVGCCYKGVGKTYGFTPAVEELAWWLRRRINLVMRYLRIIKLAVEGVGKGVAYGGFAVRTFNNKIK